MKRFFAAPLCALTLVLAGCGNNSPVPPPTIPPTTLPTTPPTTPRITPPVTPPTTPPTDPPTTETSLAGTVTAPAGGDVLVLDTMVIACYNDTETCTTVSDDGGSFADGYSYLTVVTQSGESGSYSADNLQAVQCSLFAVRDSNADTTLNAGNYLGVYTADGQNVTLVTPPQTGLAIQLIDVADLETATNPNSSKARALRTAEKFLAR